MADEAKSSKQKLYDCIKFHPTKTLLSSLAYHRTQRLAALRQLQEELDETDVRIAILYERLVFTPKQRREHREKMKKKQVL